MPRIINAYDSNSAIGDSLAKLGESIYGDGAKNEVYRTKATAQKTLNDLVTNPNIGLDDVGLAKSQLGIGGTAAGTFAGQGRSLANDRATNAATVAGGERNNIRTNAETHYGTDRRYDSDIATTGMNNASAERVGAGNNAASVTVGRGNNDTQRDIELTRDARTTQGVLQPDGSVLAFPKSEANAAHMPIPQAKDQVIGGMLQRYFQQNQPGAAGDPNANPFAAMPPQVQHVAGVDMPQQSMVHAASGMTGISRDGGVTVILPNGASIPATGFQPVDQGTALNETRGAIQRGQTAQPLAAPNATGSQAAVNAERTAGLGPKVGTILNNEVGALPGAPSVLKALTGSPQIAPGVQGARQDQDILAQQTRAILAGATGRQTTQAQKWVDELLPNGDAFANPATEATKVPKIVGALQGDHEQLRQVVQTTSDPAERTKALVQMHVLEGLIKKWSAPAAPTTGAQPAAAAAAPQGAKPARIIQNGHPYDLQPDGSYQ